MLVLDASTGAKRCVLWGERGKTAYFASRGGFPVIPGGESTVMLKLLNEFGMFESVKQFGTSGTSTLRERVCTRAVRMPAPCVRACMH